MKSTRFPEPESPAAVHDDLGIKYDGATLTSALNLQPRPIQPIEPPKGPTPLETALDPSKRLPGLPPAPHPALDPFDNQRRFTQAYNVFRSPIKLDPVLKHHLRQDQK